MVRYTCFPSAPNSDRRLTSFAYIRKVLEHYLLLFPQHTLLSNRIGRIIILFPHPWLFSTSSFLWRPLDSSRRMVRLYALLLAPIYDTNMAVTACRREVGEIVHPRTVEEASPMAQFGQMMTHKAVHLLSLFLMVYIGAEVTIGGIIILFTYVVAQLTVTNSKDGL